MYGKWKRANADHAGQRKSMTYSIIKAKKRKKKKEDSMSAIDGSDPSCWGP